MPEDKNENQKPESQKKTNEHADNGSVFLTQIKEKRAEFDQKNQKQSVFKQFIQPNSDKKQTFSSEKKVKKGVPILGILGGVAILFLIFIVLMVAVVAMGGNNSALLVTFGIDEAKLKDVLLFIVNGSFGVVAFAILLIFVISAFRLSLANKEDKIKRKSIFKQLFISVGFMLFILTIWFGTWKIVNGIKLSIPLSQLEIQTNPSNVTGLVAPVEIDFDVTTIVEALFARGNKPESIEWDFDADGEYDFKTDETTIQHRFEQEGDIKVGLVVNLEDGEIQEFSKLIEISKAEFNTTPETGSVPLEVSFDASSLERTDSPAATFEWDFDGDGKYDNKQAIATTEYTFEKIGIYNVGLRIVDIHNNFRTYSKKIEVVQDTAEKLKAVIKVSPAEEGIAPFKVTLSGVDSTSVDSEIRDYEWDLGDNSKIQYGRALSYSYKTPGTYTVILTIYNEDGYTHSDSVKIEVQKDSSAPVAKIITEPVLENGKNELEGVVPFSVSFDASHSEDNDDNIIEYAWDFNGDGEFDEYGQTIDYVFEEEGVFNVLLQTTDSDEQSDQSMMVIKTKTRDLQAILLAEPLSGSLPLKVEFDASTSVYKKGNIVTYEWDFGDNGGTEYGDAQRTHIYDEEGRFTVTLKVITEDDQTTETSRDIFVRALQLQSCFAYTPEIGSAPLSVEFDSSCSQGEIAKWKWDFGDGFISTGHSPAHIYSQKGEYTVSLELIDEKNNSSNFQSVVVVEGDL